MASTQQAFCTRCGAARAAGTRFCTSCGAPQGGAPQGGASPARPSSATAAPAPTAAVAVAVLMISAGGLAAYFSMRTATDVPRAVSGRPSAPAGGAAQGEDLPTGHPSIELPKEVLAFLDSLEADADKNPQSVEAAQKLARARYRASVINSSYRASAEQALGRLMALDAGNPEGLRISANIAYDSGEYAEAEKRFQAYLAKTPADVSAITDLGSAQLFQDRIDDAIKSYQQALGRDPKFMQAHFNMGIALQKQGKKDEAIASLRRALDAADSEEARQQIENTLAEIEGRQPMQIARSAQGSDKAAGTAAPAAAAPPAPSPPPAQGGMPMPPPAPDRAVPTSASTAFQRQAEKPLITHPMIGPRLVGFEWSSETAVRVKLADFPMDQMPPFAREKFKTAMSEKIGAIAGQNAVAGPVVVELVDAKSGRVMETLNVTASSPPAAAAAPAPAATPAPAANGTAR